METLQSSSEQLRDAEIQAEIAEVRQQLFGALADLAYPLGELVRSQLEHSISELRIGLLLVAARRPEAPEQARQQRLLLSTALEMLCLALSIHKLLLAHTQSHNGAYIAERSWTGSVILTGDYCFSRSALLAAQTNLPRVVEIFAQALKTVNEELLRRLFAVSDTLQTEPFDEKSELVDAGLRAAIVIAGIEEQTAAATIKFGQKLFKQTNSSLSPQRWSLEVPTTLAAFQRPYWQALVHLQHVRSLT